MQSLPGHHSTASSHRYQCHQLENTPHYPIVEQHLPTLPDELQRQNTSLQGFVRSEFQDFLRCGRLEYGFVGVKCNGYHRAGHFLSSCLLGGRTYRVWLTRGTSHHEDVIGTRRPRHPPGTVFNTEQERKKSSSSGVSLAHGFPD